MNPVVFSAIYQVLKETDYQISSEFLSYKNEISKGLEKFNTADEYLDNLRMRTDLSQDAIWELENLTGAIRGVFELEKNLVRK